MESSTYSLTVLVAFLTALGIASPPRTAGGEPVVRGYVDYDAYRLQLEAIAESPLARLESLGRTLGGREIYLLQIGSGKLDAKPAVLVVGGVDPTHLLGSELAVRVARQLVEQAERDESFRKVLARVTFYVIPRPAPDACEAFFTQPYVERTGNDRSTDDDRDGEFDEDGPDDLNGDGWITQIRVEDPAGQYIMHPDDDRVLIEADPKKGERGLWSVYSEGVDNDHDEAFNEDPPGGVEFNRNFTFDYAYFSRGAGPHQVSEIETRAVADFAFSHPNIAAVFTLTPEDNLMRPWKANKSAEGGRIKTTLLADDAPYVDYLAEQYREIHGGDDAPESPKVKGSFSRWAYFHYGRWSLAARGWWVPKVEPKEVEQPAEDAVDEKKEDASDDEKKKDEKRGADELNALRWFAQEKIDGFVDWQRIEHPDFPGREVEVGGFKPFRRVNPPADYLNELAEKHGQFLHRLAELLPKLSIDRVEIESLGGNVWRVKATVLNVGYLPTASKMGAIARQPLQLQAELQLPEGAALVTGHPRVQLPVLRGNGGKAEVAWLVRAANPGTKSLRLRVYSPSVGSIAKKIKLSETSHP